MKPLPGRCLLVCDPAWTKAADSAPAWGTSIGKVSAVITEDARGADAPC